MFLKLVRKVLQIGIWRFIDVGCHDKGHTAQSGLTFKLSHLIIANLVFLIPNYSFYICNNGKIVIFFKVTNLQAQNPSCSPFCPLEMVWKNWTSTQEIRFHSVIISLSDWASQLTVDMLLHFWNRGKIADLPRPCISSKINWKNIRETLWKYKIHSGYYFSLLLNFENEDERWMWDI